MRGELRSVPFPFFFLALYKWYITSKKCKYFCKSFPKYISTWIGLNPPFLIVGAGEQILVFISLTCLANIVPTLPRSCRSSLPAKWYMTMTSPHYFLYLFSPLTIPTRTLYYCTIVVLGTNYQPHNSHIGAPVGSRWRKKQFICRGVKSGRKTISCWLWGQMWGQILTSQFINFHHFYVEEKQSLSVIIKQKLSSSGVC